MARVKNPGFPHWCRVYRVTGETSFSDGETEELYAGPCLKYGSSNLRTFKTGNVIRGDYAADIPGLVRGIDGSCMIDVKDYNGEYERVTVSDCQASEMGTTVYFNISKN